MNKVTGRSVKEASKLTLKYPFVIKNLYRAGRSYQPGAGPRTLDNVISYLPYFKKRSVRSIDKSYFDNIVPHDNTNTNVIVCLSQRDFPISLHQRLLISLLYHGIDLNRVHWVITDADELGNYLAFPDFGKLVPSNFNLWQKYFTDSLNSYLDYFKQNKIIKKQHQIIFGEGSIDEYQNILDLAKTYSPKKENVHFFSSKLQWTVQSLIDSINYDPFEPSYTYVLGQTNTGKTSLVRSILTKFNNDFQEDTTLDVLKNKNLQSMPTPFSSKFNVYKFMSINIIDTPGYVRHGGSIWRHLNKFGAHFLHIPEKNILPTRSIKLTPKIFGNNTKVSKEETCFCVGGLVFLKPVILAPHSRETVPTDHQLSVTVMRNMPGKVEALTAQEVNERMRIPQKNRIINVFKWKKYIASGTEIDVIIDNVGSFKASCSVDIPDAKIYWEIELPSYVRGLLRHTENDEAKFAKLELFTEKLSQVLNKEQKVLLSEK